jgi:hypothetical protein
MTTSVRPPSSLSRFFRNPNTGEIAVGQSPNASILLWTGARGLALVWHTREQALRRVAAAALVFWALDEALRGDSPFRRVLGAGVLTFEIVRLVR